MKIRCTSEGHIYHIRIQGFLDDTSFPLLQAELESAIITSKKAIWLDCTNLKGMSAEAIAFLTLYQYILQEKGVYILIINLAYHIQFLFNTTQLDATIPVVPTIDLAYYMYQNNTGKIVLSH
jgi:anti-anti-sigma factor